MKKTAWRVLISIKVEMSSKFCLLQISVSLRHHLKDLCGLYTKQFSEIKYLISNQSYGVLNEKWGQNQIFHSEYQSFSTVLGSDNTNFLENFRQTFRNLELGQKSVKNISGG